MRYRQYTHVLLFFGFAVIQILFLLWISWGTSYNRTEPAHLGSAAYFWHMGKFDVFHVNPPLTRYIIGLPISLCQPDFDWRSYSSRPQDRSEWRVGMEFIHANSPEKVRLMFVLARCSLIPIILLGSWFGYKFASELYGQVAGVIFLLLWTFSPLVLGWGATICPDVCATSLGIVAVYTLWHWLKTPTWHTAITAGTCLGLLPLTKITWVIAFPIWALVWFIWVLPNNVRNDQKFSPTNTIPGLMQLTAILMIGVCTINFGYLFDGSFRQLKAYVFISNALTGLEIKEKSSIVATGNRFANSWLGYIPIPLPGEFVQGIDTQKLDFEQGLESYFHGEYSDHGWWYYFVYVVLVKEPLGTLLLGVLAILVTIFLSRYNASWRDEMVIVLPGLALFVFVSSQTGFSLHPRYIIPSLPFAYIWICKLGRFFVQKQCVLATITIILLVWMVGSSLCYFPHSMSHFNELIGDTKNAPKHLLGSNIDWGQNAYFLKQWIEEHPDASPLYVDYPCPEGMKQFAEYAMLPPEIPKLGWYAVGVNELYGSKKTYEWLKEFEPVDIIGYSIYIYHVTQEDLERVRLKPCRLYGCSHPLISAAGTARSAACTHRETYFDDCAGFCIVKQVPSAPSTFRTT